MGREQYQRNVDVTLYQLIDNWTVCQYSDDIHEFFESFKLCTESYLRHHNLNMGIIVKIVKDLRDFLNPHENKNLYYFTDRICDTILCRFEGMNFDEYGEFVDFVDECKHRVYLKL